MLLGTFLILKADDVADNAIFDQQLDHICRTIASTVAVEVPQWDAAPGVSPMLLTKGHAQPAGLVYQVWQRNGILLRQSPQSALATPLAPLSQVGFSTINIQGLKYRSYSLPSADGSSVVQVAEPIEDRDDLRLAMLLAYWVSLFLPLFITWRASRMLMRRSMRFLATLADGVSRQDPHDASPMRLEEAPSDFAPLLASVNGLVQRAASVISLEQRFTSVAAHELRSPLAGIRAQAQLAKGAESNQELQQSLQAVMTGVDHASRVFDQLLDLTRMEGMCQERESNFRPVDLQAVCQQVLNELRGQMQRKNIRYIDTCQVQGLYGVEFAIYLLVRNLLANAILYTPENGTVEVSSTLHADRLVFCVDDSGPGIPEADRQRVFERYCRLHKSGSEGIGLGLFIAQQAAELHNASIELLGSPWGGLCAQVSFPLQSSPMQPDV